MNTALKIILFEQLECLGQMIHSSMGFQRLKELQIKIEQDEDLTRKQEELLRLASNPYAKEYLSLRTELFQHPLVQEYKELESEFYYLSLAINQRLEKLIPERRHCL